MQYHFVAMQCNAMVEHVVEKRSRESLRIAYMRVLRGQTLRSPRVYTMNPSDVNQKSALSSSKVDARTFLFLQIRVRSRGVVHKLIQTVRR